MMIGTSYQFVRMNLDSFQIRLGIGHICRLSFFILLFFLCGQALASDNFVISISYPIGSYHDGSPGQAHLAEHLKFDQVSKQIPESDSGNAFTSQFRTQYSFSASSQLMENTLEKVRALGEDIRIEPAIFLREKNVVKQEILQRTQRHSDTEYYQQLNRKLFSGTGLDHWPVGQLAAIDALQVEETERWSNDHYTNTKALVKISGAIDVAAVKQTARKILPASKFELLVVDTRKPFTKPDRDLLAERPILESQDIGLTYSKPFKIEANSSERQITRIVWQRIYRAGKDWRERLPAHKLLLAAIGSHLREGLDEKIAGDDRLVEDWSLDFTWPAPGFWSFRFEATLADQVSTKRLIEKIDNYLKNLAENGLSEASFNRLKKRMIRSFDRRWQYPERAINILRDNTFFHGYKFAWEWPKKLAALRHGDAQQFLQNLQSPLRDGTLIIKPKDTK